MASTSSNDRSDPAASHAEDDIFAAADVAAGVTSDRMRAHAAEIIAATRERIIEQPLQAVLIAAAAGAFAALLLGAGRR